MYENLSFKLTMTKRVNGAKYTKTQQQKLIPELT